MEKADFKSTLRLNRNVYVYYSLLNIEHIGMAAISRLPFSIRILLENLLRNFDGSTVTAAQVDKLANWQPAQPQKQEIPFFPARVLMQDFTGVPGVVDLAAMREAMEKLDKDPLLINPVIPVDLVIDHSLEVDEYGSAGAMAHNMKLEYLRNRERYVFLKWARQSFRNFRIFPPGSGIIHQVNLEHIAEVVKVAEENGEMIAFPDSVLGTDSHTTMINGLGIMGWGVGGIEAEAVMLGQPYYMPVPEVVGVKFLGRLPAGITATDMVLTVTRILRQAGVVDKFVEFFGPGVKNLSVPDRATLANMAPEYGATMGFFPVDENVLAYLQQSGRGHLCGLVEQYCRAQHLYYQGHESPDYSQVIEVDLGGIVPCLAGPAKPQQLVELKNIKSAFGELLKKDGRSQDEAGTETGGQDIPVRDGSVVIAAITSCTNTSNPNLLIGAALLAKKARAKGLTVRKNVKTSFAPGSRLAEAFLREADLMADLEALGFYVVGLGCTTCIGNSGALPAEVAAAITRKNLNVVAVLSGNRNFEARIHPLVKSNYLASPALVVAFALAGRIDIDLMREPVGFDPSGQPVWIGDIWPTAQEIEAVSVKVLTPGLFREKYRDILEGDANWQKLPSPAGGIFTWDDDSTYIRRPPYFDDFEIGCPPVAEISKARVLLLLGDSVTTDHISPAGAIQAGYPAAIHLEEKGISPADFNSYGSRRGNHELMVRGTFANTRLKNRLPGARQGSYSIKFPENEEMFVFDAAMAYQKEKTPLLVIGGREYGTGSSRDWAAKGPALLGIRAVIAESFERIHRSNLVGMGILPLEFLPGDSAASLGITGTEVFDLNSLSHLTPAGMLKVSFCTRAGQTSEFSVKIRLDTEAEVAVFRNGGILPRILRKMAI